MLAVKSEINLQVRVSSKFPAHQADVSNAKWTCLYNFVSIIVISFSDLHYFFVYEGNTGFQQSPFTAFLITLSWEKYNAAGEVTK